MPNPDRIPRAPFITGLAGGAIVALLGIWLAAAPFTAGYQPDGAEWAGPTIVGVATGGFMAALGLSTLAVVAAALRDEVRRRGLAPERHAETAEQDRDPTDPADDDIADPAELETILAPLAAALLEDLRNGHPGTPTDTGPSQPGPPDQPGTPSHDRSA